MSMHLSLHQRGEAQLSIQMQQMLRHADTAKVSALVEGLTVYEISRMCADARDHFGMVVCDENSNGISARLARGTAFRLANKHVFPYSALPLNDFELIEAITDAVNDEFLSWWSSRHEYRPVDRSESEQIFMQTHGPIDWGTVRTSRAIIASDTGEDNGFVQPVHSQLYAPDGKELVSTTIAECVANIEKMFGIDPAMRAVFERVRTAVYGSMTRENIDDILPRMRKSYDRAWLQPKTIELLRNNDPEKLLEFSNKTEKGVFVYGFDEKVKGQPSVAEQMYTDFMAERNAEHPTYEGRYLMDDTGELLAWFTYWQTPTSPSSVHRSMLEKYLQQGVTGGKMNYQRDPPKANFVRNIDYTLMLDTLRGAFPLAAARLVAKMASEVQSINSKISTILGYRVHSLQMKAVDGSPAFPGFREPIRNTENLNSSKFFGDRGCAPFAYDFKRDGPMSERTLSDDRKMFLNPEWVAFSGKFSKFQAHSRALWHQIQQKYGDVTSDC